jgi:DNA-binding XRE family transcriptional regulator
MQATASDARAAMVARHGVGSATVAETVAATLGRWGPHGQALPTRRTRRAPYRRLAGVLELEYGRGPSSGGGPLGLMRVDAGLPLSRAAALLGVSVRTVIRWEYGERRPNAAECHGIAAVYGVPVADVLAAVAGRRAA